MKIREYPHHSGKFGLSPENNILNSLFFIEKFFLTNRLTHHPNLGIFHFRRCRGGTPFHPILTSFW
jgi:hypothetical protein